MHEQRGGVLHEIGRGAGAFLGGVLFVARTPGILGWALLPACAAVGLGGVLAVVGVWGAVRLSETILQGSGGLALFGRLLLELVLGGVAVFTALVVALAVAQPLTRVALERIAKPLEEALDDRLGTARRPASGLLASLGVALSALGLTLPAVSVLELITLFAPEAAIFTEPVAFAISALGVTWELLDHPFSRHGLTMRERLRWVRRSFLAVLGFATAAQVFLLIPGLDLFLLPVGIAGATRLFAERGSFRELPPPVPPPRQLREEERG